MTPGNENSSLGSKPPSPTSGAELSTAKSVASTPRGERFREALQKIASEDYRGNEPESRRIAREALDECQGCIAEADGDVFGPPHACEDEW